MNLQKILEKYNVVCDVRIILEKWNESDRYYHNLDHLYDLITQIQEDFGSGEINESNRDKLIISALFHDLIYDVSSSTNEEDSAEFFLNLCKYKHDIDVVEIKQIILDSKYHISSTPLSERFQKYDMKICERDLESLIEWEKKIRNEYSIYENTEYKIERIEFLNKILEKYPNNVDNILDLINFVKTNYI